MNRTRWIVYSVLVVLVCSVAIVAFRSREQPSSPGSFYFTAAGDSAFYTLHLAEAERQYRMAIGASTEDDSQSSWGVFERTFAMLGLARTVSALGRFQEADSLALRALEMNELAYGSQSGELIYPLQKIKEYYEFACRDSMVRVCEAKVASIVRQVEPTDESSSENPGSPMALVHEGTVQLRSGRPDLAQDAYARAIAAQVKEVGPEDARVYETRNLIAQAWASAKQYERAMDLFRALQARQESKVGPNSLQLVELLDQMARIELARKQYRQAEALLSRIVTLKESNLGRVRPELVPTLRSLAEAQAGQKHFADAGRTRQRSLEINSLLCCPDHPQLAVDLLGVATMESKSGRLQEAREDCRRALSIFSRALGASDRRAVESRRLLEDLNTSSGERSS